MGPERTREVSSKEKLLSVGREIVQRRNLQHLAFIVDGNRRWAERHGLPELTGHSRALKVLLDRVEDSAKMGIPVISCWLFSTENWGRGEEVVNKMFDLGIEMAPQVLENLTELNLRFAHIGRADGLRQDLLEVIIGLEEATMGNTGSTVLGCIDYGGREEMVQAVNRGVRSGIREFTSSDVAGNLYTASFPDPDLVIRTGGELRTSGFMIWQTAYSELYFSNKFFPDFTRSSLLSALREFDKRERRFGR